MMSEKFTLEVLHFRKMVGPWFSKLFQCKESTRAVAPQPAGSRAWAQYIFASELYAASNDAKKKTFRIFILLEIIFGILDKKSGTNLFF